ncbi:Eco57I restriction-modification methylase domain-containing protein [Halogeometricum borinquense]|nr:N-6 DNA methylase [Halogeometricum borinquense]
MDLLHELRDENEAKFVKGAYDFWEATYADEPDEVPNSWDPFINGKQSLRDFMFCLESGHALLARLLLAKATEDHDFFAGTGYDGMDDYFRGLQGFGDTINLDAFPVAADDLIDDMQEQLVEGLFQDDIFIWWTDGYREQIDTQHASGPSRFEDVARGSGDVERVSETTRDRFSRAVAEVFFNVLRFDFQDVEGDLLGDLYQRYFDPETRKALGEFYTPQPVIDYIMDGVGYERGVSNERLIDPSCGSGTFLVEAVERYITDVENFEDNPDWEEHLRDLCTRPRIVGLDIHPFAVLMAQIRFVVAILPAYREAKTQNPEFTIRRLPIYRTDTLRNERELTGADLGDDGTRQMTFDAMTEDDQDVRIPVPLPVEVDEDEVAETEDGFLVRRVRMPLFDTIQLETGVKNFGEYFAALQGVLDTVKDHMALAEEFGGDFDWEYKSGLEERINQHTSRDYSGVEEFFTPYVNDMLENVRYLKEEHNDGRLFKMFEDTVLALVVKNYMEYDYVVGNPPYVNIKYISDTAQERYTRLYDSAFGRFDLYVLFIERGLEMLTEDGELGYITSNKFARAEYGREIRRLISSEYSLAEYIDFGDTEVFKDATNYPCILFVDRDRNRKTVPYAKIRREQDNILDVVASHLGKENYLSDGIEISRYPSERLSEEVWTFTPEPVREVVTKLQQNGTTTVEEACLGVRQGVSSGGDDAFIVSPEYADQKELENELLYPLIRGENVRRWIVDWEEEVAIYPYDDDGELVDFSEYPSVKSHLEDHREYLEDRYCVKKGGKGIYEYDGPRCKSVFEGDFRIPVPDMATENQFSYADGYNCFKNTAYVLTFNDEQPYSELELLGLLNSAVSEFYIKQKSPFLNDQYFRYKSQYIDPIPLPAETDRISSVVDDILAVERLGRKVENFPDSYIDEYDGEVAYITYEWQTTRKPVNAEINTNDDGTISVQAGRTDSIVDAAMHSEDNEARKRRAEYVYAAVDGCNVKSGKEITIPIPRSDDGVVDLLDRLEADREEVRQTDIEDLEAEIDDAVYDLFDLTEDEREVVEDYLEVF